MRRFLLIGSILTLSCISLVAVTEAQVGPCPVFPADNYWNKDISAEPVHPQSASIIANINSHGRDDLHPDFGGIPSLHYGIPWITVDDNQTPIDEIVFKYDDESDLVDYPIPYDAPIEGLPGATGGDRHVIAINTDTCILYELYAAVSLGDETPGNNNWTADSGAVFDLNSNALRPDTWTSADAAGLPIFAGLARCDEASTGEINHAFRFTVEAPRTAPGDANVYVFPARHEAGGVQEPMAPPLGARLRLKADYPEAGFQGQALAIVKALKRYGMILADTGSNWFITGDYPVYQPGCWNDTQVNTLKTIPGTAFEVLAYPGTSVPNVPHFSTLTPTLTWSRITWATSYEIQVSKTLTFPPATSTTYTGSDTSVTILPALTEGTYYWRVRAKGANNTLGNWSSTGSFVIALIS